MVHGLETIAKLNAAVPVPRLVVPSFAAARRAVLESMDPLPSPLARAVYSTGMQLPTEAEREAFQRRLQAVVDYVQKVTRGDERG